MYKLYILILAVISFSACQTRETTQKLVDSNHYAHGFEIKHFNSLVRLTVFNPWEKARNISVNYYLIDKNLQIPDSLKNKNVIRTPVKRVICLSTTHIAFLEALNEIETVVGVSGSQYVSNKNVRKKIDTGDVVDVGYGHNLNYELILNQKPELVMVYGIGSEVTSYKLKLEELGIPVLMVAEYLEELPLGKTEWVKFVATIFNKEKEADSFFNKIENDYLRLKELTIEKQNRPKVLVGSPYKDSWWVPGANSYMANLIKDARGDYLGKNNSSHESYVISFEHALTWANEADVWINMSNMASKKEILLSDSRFKSFKIFNSGKIFNNIKGLNEYGGNDFWESGTIYPNLILQDLIAIFYPDLINKELIYYKEIK